MKLAWLTIVGGCFVGMVTARSSAKLNPKEAAGGGGGGGNGGGRPSLTTYDQRQTGKYNIHVNIKDVKIISVDGEKFDGEFGDDTIYDYGDYDYDPSHLTISPLPIFGSGASSTTAKPPKSTTKTPVAITSTKRPTTTTTTEAPSMEEDEDSVEPMEPPKRPVIAEDDPMKIEANPSYPVHNSSSNQILHAPLGTTTPPPSNIYIFKPTPNYHPHPVHYDYQEIPVEVIVEPVLKPKYRNANSRISATGPNRRNRYRKNPASAGPMDSMSRHSHSNIEALPSNEAVQPQQAAPLEATPCTKGEFLDRSGKCRTRRSGGGIFRLLNLLTAFKEKDD
ncbi:uncharacterized protein LOC6033344 isoform X1 [Culex quinquefasciatus]|uniref:uncharacterized protein LOC6033344 isoform X1 n=1 Tax=Culex quinquefasciatus TaxID=7176 RepID=UPI0018E2CCD9|nr:uncharacterized protein LOC6033344 isoform X1 [Culex quinquefasciatus]